MLPAAAKGETYEESIAGMRAIQAADIKLATIGERLARANVGLCSQTEYRTGLIVHDIAQYATSERPAAKAVFGFEAPISVEGVVHGSPAERAGITANAGLLSIDGVTVDSIIASVEGDGSYARMAVLSDRIEAALKDGTLVVGLVRNGVKSQATIHGEMGCSSRFQIVLDGQVNAQADGQYVQVSGPLYDFAPDEQELATVVAHELAHNILDHRKRLNALGITRGIFGSFGRSARLVRFTESEADRLSVYLMANAGYNPQVAPLFWKRFGKGRGLGVFSSATHLRTKAREALVRNELTRLAHLRHKTPAGQPLFPDFARPPFSAIE